MSIDEQRREASQRFLPATSRKDTHKRKRYRWLWGVLLLGFTALVVGGGIILSLPFPLQRDASTLYSTDWSKDLNAWNGPGWHARLFGGVHSDHGGFFSVRAEDA